MWYLTAILNLNDRVLILDSIGRIGRIGFTDKGQSAKRAKRQKRKVKA